MRKLKKGIAKKATQTKLQTRVFEPIDVLPQDTIKTAATEDEKRRQRPGGGVSTQHTQLDVGV